MTYSGNTEKEEVLLALVEELEKENILLKIKLRTVELHRSDLNEACLNGIDLLNEDYFENWDQVVDELELAVRRSGCRVVEKT